MKKVSSILTIYGLVMLNSPLWAQTLPDASSATASSKEEEKSSDEKSFTPHWEHEIGLSHSNQQAGQNTNTLSYAGTYRFDESGNFISATIDGSTLKVEGAPTKSGSLAFGAGLGLGSFTPSLSAGFQAGDNVLRVLTGDFALGIQLWDPFSISLSVGGNAGNHQGDVSQFYPSLTGLVQIDTSSWNSSLGMTFVPWDWWSVSLTASNEYDITYQIQSIVNKKKRVSVSQTDHIASLTLGLDFTLFKGFVLGVLPQAGQEYSPAGSVYSPLAGGLVQFAAPTTTNFAAGMVSVTYSFE